MISLRRSEILAGRRTQRAAKIRANVLVRVGASSIDDELASASTVDDVDRIVRRHLNSNDVPDYIAKDFWVWRQIKGNGHTLELRVAPDYAAIGRSSPWRIGKSSEFLAQEYADKYDAILPSQKMLADLEASADVKIPFIAVQKNGGADDSVDATVRANDKANDAFAKYGASNNSGTLNIGYRKAYVTRPNLNGDYIAIRGGRWSESGGLVQPTSGHAHTTGQISGTPNYSDYSHGIVLVSRKAKLDGIDVDLRDDVFGSRDPSIYGLVSDEGRFDPVFPNAGSGSVGKFSSGTGAEVVSPYSASDTSIASIQNALVSLGYDVGKFGADGKLGPDTNAAIVKFKSEHGLPSNIVIDQTFRDALSTATAEKAASASASGIGSKPLLVAGALVVAGLLVWMLV